jgi:anti-sigma-K factor RskA
VISDPHLLTGAYAAGALDGEGGRRFEHHLKTCATCRQEVSSFAETAAALGAAVSSPAPATLRVRVFDQIARTPQEPPSRRDGRVVTPAERWIDPTPRPSRLTTRSRSAWGRRWIAPAAGFALIAGGGGLAGLGAIELDRAHHIQQQATWVRQQQDEVLAVIADPTARRQTAATAGGGAVTLVAARGRAVLLADNLPALAPGRAYQLWLVRPGATSPLALGPEGAAGAVPWTRLVSGVDAGDAVAVSVEPAGGSPRPTTTPISLVRV